LRSAFLAASRDGGGVRKGTVCATRMFMSMNASVIPLPCGPDHSAQCRVALADDAGWNIYVEMDDRVVSLTHCSDWHHVERLCDRIEREWDPFALQHSAATDVPNGEPKPSPHDDCKQ